MNQLFACGACQRYIRSNERVCPFCGESAVFGAERSPPSSLPRGRSRATAFAMRAALIATVAPAIVACGGDSRDNANGNDTSGNDLAGNQMGGTAGMTGGATGGTGSGGANTGQGGAGQAGSGQGNAGSSSNDGDIQLADAGGAPEPEDAGFVPVPIYGGVFPDPLARVRV